MSFLFALQTSHWASWAVRSLEDVAAGVGLHTVQSREEHLRDGSEGRQAQDPHSTRLVCKLVKCERNASVVD